MNLIMSLVLNHSPYSYVKSLRDILSTAAEIWVVLPRLGIFFMSTDKFSKTFLVL
jgi:hypothetical protein